MEGTSQKPVFLTFEAAARKMSMARRTFYRHIYREWVPLGLRVYKLGGKAFVEESQFDNFILEKCRA